LDKVGLPGKRYLNRYPHEFSGGQRQRISIARCLAVRPELIICDESVSALDVSVQAQVLNLLKDLQLEFGLTYLFISHDLSVVKFMSDMMAVMNAGKFVEYGPSESIYANPKEAYTERLIDSIPRDSIAQIALRQQQRLAAQES
jgi:peptide/nickel transport system ATP-binding protein